MIGAVIKRVSAQVAALDNEFTFTTGFELVGNELTFHPAWRGVINNVEYTNIEQVVLDIPFAEEGLERIEIAVFDTNGNFVRISGDETAGFPTAPTVPNNTLLATFYKVTDSSISEPAELGLQGMMIEKLYTWVMLLSLDIARIDASLSQIRGQVVITSNTVLDATHNGKILKIKSNATITIPSTLPDNFICYSRSFTGATGYFVAGVGTVMDAPKGLILEPFKMATLFKDGSTATCVLEGELKT